MVASRAGGLGDGDLPKTEFAWADDVSIAYQVMGAGPIDLIVVPGILSHVEFFHQLPGYTDFLHGLAAFARVIVFDKRGQGLSDGLAGAQSLEARMDDIRAVMDAAGCERAALFGYSEGCPMSILFAATYPERSTALALYAGFARFTRTADYPFMPELTDILKMVPYWGSGGSIKGFAPGIVTEENRAVWAKAESHCCSPSALKRMIETNASIDIRPLLPTVQTPTLVAHRRKDKSISVENGRYLAEHIPNARYVEFPGEDHGPWVGDHESLTTAIGDFLTEHRRAAAEPDRALATVLFTDIVESSQRLAELGDRKWRELLDAHDRIANDRIAQQRGKLIKQTGDGLLVIFDGPGRAIKCALAVRDDLRSVGLLIRAGLHIGEVEMREDDISGVAVHLASRVQEMAKPDEVLVTRTITDLVAGSDLRFEEHGEHQLKGIPGTWQLFAVSA